MRVLGVDPGSVRTGYGVIEKKASKLIPINYGTIVLGSGEMELRLAKLYRELTEVISKNRPHVVAVEGIFYAKNAGSALKLGHARGVILLTAGLSDLKIYEYAPTVVKRAVTSSGRADKAQVSRMVTLLLGLKQPPDIDAADALAVAMCCAQTVSGLEGGRT
jgi:crossover junction endodeoxyribonuclease RuvC